MRLAEPHEVLLLSLLPDAHGEHIALLRKRGAVVRVACEPHDALSQLARSPSLILVDLVHGPAIDRDVIHVLNHTRGSSLVVALHEGDLERFHNVVSDLEVDGFCTSRDWRPLESVAGLCTHKASRRVH